MSVTQTQLLQIYRELERRIAEIDVRQGGPMGPRGSAGPEGRKGEKGDQGPKGDKGEAGPRGERGQQGPKGEKGDKGPAGPRGERGKAGPVGPRGPAGPAGQPGSSGEDGVSVVGASVDFDGYLRLELSNGDEIEAGKVFSEEEIREQIVYVSGGAGGSSGGAPPHNNLIGVQGNGPEFYHLNEAEWTTVIDWVNNGIDWSLIVNTPTSFPPDAHDLTFHTDVDLTGNPLAEGQGLWYDANTGLWKNRSVNAEKWPTGLADGGTVTVNGGNVEVAAGIGVLVDSFTNPVQPAVVTGLTWGSLSTAITAAPAVAGSIVWVSLSSTAVPGTPSEIGGIPLFEAQLEQYPTPPSPTLAKQEIFVGVLFHNGTEWLPVNNPKVIDQAPETLREYLINVEPPYQLIQGGQVSEEAGFALAQAAGTIWAQNANWQNDKSDPNRMALGASNPISFKYTNRDFSSVSGFTTAIDPSQYDNAGTVVTVGGSTNSTTIQRLYLDPTGNYWVLWGQNVYISYLSAAANIGADDGKTVVPFALQNSIFLGHIVSTRDQTNWSTEAVFFPASSGGGTAGGGVPITDHGGLTGLLDDDHPQYLTEARGDLRYYTEAELDAGQLDNRYYTETELDGGQLDNRYYTETEVDGFLAGKADLVHTHDTSDVISGVFDDARISESSVTQHQAALVIDGSQLVGTIDGGTY